MYVADAEIEVPSGRSSGQVVDEAQHVSVVPNHL